MNLLKYLLIPLLLIIGIVACSDDSDDGVTDNFDRQAMLAHWADHLIVPGYEALAADVNDLNAAALNFQSTPDATTLTGLIDAWETAYITWQQTGIYEIGPAESVRLLNNMNTYPTDVALIIDNIASGDTNFELPSQIAAQGFPALDYLLFGTGNTASEIVTFFTNDSNAAANLAYLVAVTDRMKNLADGVLEDWQNSYRDEFVNNSGNSATASVDKIVNDYIFYYEKHLRAGKVGIPVGVFSGDVLADRVEAFYARTYSKMFLQNGLDAMIDFYSGQPFNGGMAENSLKAYIEYLEVEKDGQPLTTVIEDQFEDAKAAIADLQDDFVAQLTEDTTPMFTAYDEMQKNVVNLKVDMLQALNINVDFVDSDGD